ncbi:MAG: biotin--[acetyl-CoA-carboxylase] ligase, partial [Novosphingobium sp.]
PGSLALVAGVAVHETVSPFLPPPVLARLKWPNDVMIGRAKLSGILLEREGDSVIVGVGVNLAMTPEIVGRETVALSNFGPAPDRNCFAECLAENFAAEVGRWRSLGLAAIVSRWLVAAHPVGTPLRVGDPGEEPLTGTFAGLSGDGALQLRLMDGTTRTVYAGDVQIAEE